MGFGSYDESEYEQHEIDASEIETEDESRTDFEGEVAFESGADNDDLLTQLSEIKAEKNQRE